MCIRGRSYPVDKHVSSADSIMEKVIFFAPLYERIIESYKAELYIKGWVNIRKKKHILRYIPSMFRPKTVSYTHLLGKTITNEVFMVDLCKMPHVLVAGATGQGKSCLLYTSRCV